MVERLRVLFNAEFDLFMAWRMRDTETCACPTHVFSAFISGVTAISWSSRAAEIKRESACAPSYEFLQSGLMEWYPHTQHRRLIHDQETRLFGAMMAMGMIRNGINAILQLVSWTM
eukprot:6190923-Pleurochrysis_carterae.AAC.1